MKSKYYDNIASTNYLSNLCRDDTPLRGRFALLSVQKEVLEERTDQIITFIEYTQLIILLLITNSKIYGSQVTHPLQLYDSFFEIVKIVSPGNFLPVTKEGQETVKRVIVACITLFLFRVALFGYIMLLAFTRKNGLKFLIHLWQWIFRLQAKVLNFIFASLYVNTFDRARNNELGLTTEERYCFMVLCMTMLVLEFAFSLVLATQFNNVLPYKRFSAAKDNYSELSLLLQKFLIHLIRRIFGFGTVLAIWSYTFISIIIGAARVYHILNKLQVYNFKGLKFQLGCFVSTLTFGFCSLAHEIMNSKQMDINFMIITWIILTILAMKLANAYLERRVHMLIFEKCINKKQSPEALAHKLIIVKEILKRNQVPMNTTANYDFYHLLFSTLNVRISHKIEFLDLNDKETRNSILTDYLEELMAQFPKNDFLKLFAAYRYARKNKLYGLAIKTLAEIRNSSSPTIVVSKAILKDFIKTKTQSDYQDKTYILDLFDFCQSLSNLNKLKLRMITQAKLQWNICNEIISLKPNLSNIRTLGQKAYYQKQKIENNITKLLKQMPESFVQPYSLYSAYSLFMGYCPEEYSRYQEMFFKKCQVYEKSFENDQMFAENILQDKTFCIVVSGEKDNSGQIIYHSPQLVQVLGKNLIGDIASAFVPPFLRVYTDSLVKSLSGRNALAIQNARRFQFFYHSKGYMIPMNYYLNINPSFYGGLSYIFMCRCADSAGKEYILLNEEGEIEAFTKNIGDVLGLFSSKGSYLSDTKISMAAICPEFETVQQAFNIIKQNSKTAEKNFPMNLDEAEKLYSVFTDQGKDISFTPVQYRCSSQNLTYKCTIKSIQTGTKVGKLLTLEKIGLPSSTLVFPQEKAPSSSTSSSDEKEDDGGFSENFEKLKSQMTTRNDDVKNTVSSARNLLSPKSPRVPLILPKKTPTNLNQTSYLQQSKHNQKGWLEKHKPHWYDQTKSQSAKLYKQALRKPYYPLFYKVLIALLYATFTLVFAMYLYTTIRMQSGISDLQTSKQILRMAEARNNLLGISDGNTRFIWSFATQSNSFTQMITSSVASLPRLLIFTKLTVENLQKENDDLFSLTTSLRNTERSQLFEKDVRFFDMPGSYINLTSFQATDRIIETSLKYIATAQISLPQAVPPLRVVLRNALNDLLDKNIKISASFKAALHRKKDDFVVWITNYFAVAFSLLMVVVLVFLFVLHLQAKSESKNMLALIKLKPESVQKLSQDFLIFRNIVFESDCSQSKEVNADPFYTQSLKKSDAVYHKNHGSTMQYPNFKGFWVGYYLKLTQIILLILVLFGLFLASFILFKNYLNQLSSKADQILFVEQMTSKLGVVSGSFLELVSENNMTMINNIPASDSISIQITQISDMIDYISDVLGIGASQTNPLIQSILYEDACQYIDPVPLHKKTCEKLANYQEKAGLANLLNNFKLSMDLVYSGFVNSNRTSDALLALQIEVFNKISAPVFLVLQKLNVMIAEVLNRDFENLVMTSQSLNISANTGILVLIVLECFVIHILIINQLKKKESIFKHLLELFPACVVLPNFMLKSYIVRTSKQNFNLSLDSA